MHVNDSIEKLLAGRWVAGHHPSDALERTKYFNSKRMGTLINFLGEDITNPKDVDVAVNTYMNLVYNISKRKLNASLSMKPTQLGLSIDYKLMEFNYLKIVEYAKEKRVFVWLDMEEPEFISQTIKAYLKGLRFGNSGICLQSYLKRSARDLQTLQSSRAVIRLVKGAYNINKNAGFDSKDGINENYTLLMEKLFEKSNSFMIATHDNKIIDMAISLNKKYKRNVTYSMLNGIRNSYAIRLVKSGNKVALYVPFGSDWIGYSLRRLREQGHLLLIIRSFFERQDI